MKKKKAVNIKILTSGLFMFLCFSAIIARLYFLQIMEHERLFLKSERQYTREVRIKRERGIIYDRNSKILAVSVRADSVFANPKEIDDVNKTAVAIAKIFKKKKREIVKKLRSKKGFVWIERKAGPKEIEAIKQHNFKGIGFLQENKRFYPRRNLASSIIGFVGMDNRGLAGLEYEFDKYVGGEEEIIVIEKDAKGRNIAYAKKWSKPDRGCDLTTTIDEVIQHIAERELEKQVKAVHAKGGVVVVMEPHSGDILAMANYPDFNPNSFNQYSASAWVNKAVAYSYEPGSTFKLILAAAAFEEGLVKPDDIFFCENGQIEIGGIVIHDTHKFQWMTIRQIISKSSNIGAVKIGKKLNKDLFYKYIDKFGFGKKTNINLPGESAGILRYPERWSNSSLGAIAIGHEIAVTPLQLITALSAVANGGTLMRPRIVKSISKKGDVIKAFPPKRITRVISRETAELVTDILGNVVSEGTGKLADVVGYAVVGKTGTAQKIDPVTKTYSKDKFLASFIGFLPAEKPAVSILVMIDEPTETIYGGKVAAPVFREIAKQVMHYLRISPEVRDEVKA